MPANLQSRLRRILAAKSWSRGDLAKAAGASKSSVTRWMNDGRIKMDPEFAFRLEDASGFSARWILLGTGPSDAVTVAKDMLQRHEVRIRTTSPN